MRSCRKFQAKHLNEGGLKVRGESHKGWSKREEVWSKRGDLKVGISLGRHSWWLGGGPAQPLGFLWDAWG